MTSADASSLQSARQPYSQAPKKFIIDLETRSKSFCLPVPVHRSNWTVETTESSDDRPKSAIALRRNQMHMLHSSKLDLEKASTQAPKTTTDRNRTKSKNQSARPSAFQGTFQDAGVWQKKLLRVLRPCKTSIFAPFTGTKNDPEPLSSQIRYPNSLTTTAIEPSISNSSSVRPPHLAPTFWRLQPKIVSTCSVLDRESDLQASSVLHKIQELTQRISLIANVDCSQPMSLPTGHKPAGISRNKRVALAPESFWARRYKHQSKRMADSSRGDTHSPEQLKKNFIVQYKSKQVPSSECHPNSTLEDVSRPSVSEQPQLSIRSRQASIVQQSPSQTLKDLLTCELGHKKLTINLGDLKEITSRGYTITDDLSYHGGGDLTKQRSIFSRKDSCCSKSILVKRDQSSRDISRLNDSCSPKKKVAFAKNKMVLLYNVQR